MNIFRSDTEYYSFTYIVVKSRIRSLSIRKLYCIAVKFKEYTFSVLGKYRVNKVHLWASDKSRCEHITRLIVKICRSIHLLNNTIFHNNDSCTHCHSLSLVMCYIDKCCLKSFM